MVAREGAGSNIRTQVQAEVYILTKEEGGVETSAVLQGISSACLFRNEDVPGVG